jgi:hypothetical protein
MYLIMDPDNPLTGSDSPLQGELHLEPGEIVTVIGPTGDELLVWPNETDNTLESE